MSNTAGGSSRRSFLKRAAAIAAGGGTLALLDQLAGPITRAEAKTDTPGHDEQYRVDGLMAILDNGVTVVLPPLYKYMITCRLKQDRTWNAKELQKAQVKLEKALATVETGKPKTAAGLTVVVAWGLPYFRTSIWPQISSSARARSWPGVVKPVDAMDGPDAVLDAVRFDSDPRDPGGLVLEDNEVMIMIRSDSLIILEDTKGKLFKDTAQSGYVGDIFDVTSVRTGFVGRGFDKPSVAKQLAVKAQVPGADKIPDRGQLMMGFTSTQQAALGPDNIPNFETLGWTTVKRGDYFASGCAMHLSHMYEDLPTWYGKGYDERVRRMFSPRVTASDGSVTIPNGPDEVAAYADVVADAGNGKTGHNSLLQQVTRLPADVTDAYGVFRPKGTPVPVREDFNTLDQPFSSSGTPQNAPGLHFVVFVPTSGRFHAARRAMDGIMSDGTRLPVAATNAGINAMLRTTHRQNFLVPPRTHRSFPMAELVS